MVVRVLFLLILLAMPRSVLAQVELSFYSGRQEAAPGRLHAGTLGDNAITWQGRSFRMPPYYGLRATWWRDSGLGLGVEFNHAKAYAADPAALGFDRLELSDGLNLLTANLWLRARPMGRVQPYAGAGLGLAIPHVDIQPSGQAHTFGYQATGPAAQWVLGAAYPLNDRWSLFGEYKGTWSSHRIQLDSGQRINTDLRTEAINLGLSLRF